MLAKILLWEGIREKWKAKIEYDVKAEEKRRKDYSISCCFAESFTEKKRQLATVTKSHCTHLWKCFIRFAVEGLLTSIWLDMDLAFPLLLNSSIFMFHIAICSKNREIVNDADWWCSKVAPGYVHCKCTQLAFKIFHETIIPYSNMQITFGLARACKGKTEGKPYQRNRRNVENQQKIQSQNSVKLAKGVCMFYRFRG